MLDWHGCYEGSWRGLIVPEAFAHPAKFAPGLVRRIYGSMLERGWLAPGDLVGDPFGGIGGGGLIAAYAGLRWVGVELEPRFVELGARNIALHAEKLRAMGLPAPALIRGDSRRFAELVGAAGIVTSPPYAETLNHGGGPDTEKDLSKRSGGSLRAVKEGYGKTLGQIGELPTGDLAAVVTSPPFLHGRSDTTNSIPNPGLPTEHNPEEMGSTPGQINNMPPGDLAGVVTSPPYEKSIESRGDGIDWGKACERGTRTAGRGAIADGYGVAEGQIGADAGETYWQAVATVYAQCLAALKPATPGRAGGVMAVVVKDYVKGGQRVPLCDDTLRLLERIGFEPLCRARAHLVREEREAGLMGEIVTRTERKSFFRRLAEKKGSPRIDWEEVLFVRAGLQGRQPLRSGSTTTGAT